VTTESGPALRATRSGIFSLVKWMFSY
jgi:hypothetical protein